MKLETSFQPNSPMYSLSMPLKHKADNLFLKYASFLLGEVIFLNSISSDFDIKKLHSTWIEKIQKFEQALFQTEYDLDMILAARYCLCTFLDEFVLTKKWGSQSFWSEQTLLSIFCNETCGGEKFYVIIDAMSEKSQKNIHFLHFIYILLCIGYKGRLYDKDADIIQATQQRLFQKISPFLKNFEQNYFNLISVDKSVIKKSLPLWPILAFIGASFLLSETFFEAKIYELEKPLWKDINSFKGKL